MKRQEYVRAVFLKYLHPLWNLTRELVSTFCISFLLHLSSLTPCLLSLYPLCPLFLYLLRSLKLYLLRPWTLYLLSPLRLYLLRPLSLYLLRPLFLYLLRPLSFVSLSYLVVTTLMTINLAKYKLAICSHIYILRAFNLLKTNVVVLTFCEQTDF